MGSVCGARAADCARELPARGVGGLDELVFQVYYLKYCDAHQVLPLLKQVLGGTMARLLGIDSPWA